MAGKRKSKGVSKDLKSTLKRSEVLTAIQRILDEALQRLDNRYTKNSEKIQWSRIVAQAASASAALLRDEDLDQLTERVKRLEEAKK